MSPPPKSRGFEAEAGARAVSGLSRWRAKPRRKRRSKNYMAAWPAAGKSSYGWRSRRKAAQNAQPSLETRTTAPALASPARRPRLSNPLPISRPEDGQCRVRVQDRFLGGSPDVDRLVGRRELIRKWISSTRAAMRFSHAVRRAVPNRSLLPILLRLPPISRLALTWTTPGTLKTMVVVRPAAGAEGNLPNTRTFKPQGRLSCMATLKTP